VHNLLTEQEAAEGWELLFDGKTMDAWRGYKSEVLPKNWVIEEDAMSCAPCLGDDQAEVYRKARGAFVSDIITKEQYENFDLKLEWKIAPGGNSGIFYRVQELHDKAYKTGPEMQILDNVRHKDFLNNNLTRSAGAAYDVYAPTSDMTRPAGEWNSVRILVYGSHVEHWMNSEKIVEYELLSPEWEERVAVSKWPYESAEYGRMETGHIGLQDHEDAVWFRNIKIKRLPGR
jgi:hypothetical protein